MQFARNLIRGTKPCEVDLPYDNGLMLDAIWSWNLDYANVDASELRVRPRW